MNTEQDRADFEAWYQHHHGDRDVYVLDESGEYADKQVQGAFNVWQAAIAHDRQDHLRTAAKMMPSDAEILACLRPLYSNDVAAAMGAEDDLRTARLLLSRYSGGQPAASAEPNAHTDDDAVDHFAAAMKEKLAQARAKGRHGWHECAPADLSAMLRAHVEKGDPRDVANFCMFLWSLGQPISAAPVAQEPVLRIYAEGSRRAVTEWLDGARDLPDGDHILFAAPVAAQAQPSGNPGELPVVNQQMTTDTALADTQRAIIEAAERRGYARAEAENVGYRTDAGRYRFIRPGDKDVWCSSGDDLLSGVQLDAAIDTARAAKGAA